MDYGSMVTAVLKLIDEYSRKGTTAATVKTVDYRLKMPEAVNAILMDLASTTGKLAAEWTIVNSPVLNEVSRDTSSIKNHIPGTDDYIAILTGALSYFLEVTDSYDVYVEEEMAGVWTTLVHLTPTAAVATFTELKGLLTLSAATNSIRIRLAGDYPYSYRNYILYPYSFPSVNSVQQNRPFFLVDLPTDWLKFNNTMIRRDIRQWMPFSEYKITPTQFGYNRYATGELLVNYYRKPTAIVVADPSTPSVAELAQALDAAPDATQIVPFGVAGTILTGDNPSASSYFFNLYEVRKAYLLGPEEDNGLSAITNVNGW